MRTQNSRARIPKTRLSVSQKVYETMLRALIVGEIPPGELLAEAVLAERFRASRTPVREACISLQNEGLLRGTPRKGFIVTEITPSEVRDLYQARLMVEPAAAELAAGNDLRSELFERWNELHDRMEALVAGEINFDTLLEMGRQEHSFHTSISEASGNRTVARFVSTIMTRVRRVMLQYSYRRAVWKDIAEHRNISQAIQDKDREAARRLMYDHIAMGGQQAMQLFTGTSLISRESSVSLALDNT
jgi:DNA-binding GntR family transcriptional regulator